VRRQTHDAITNRHVKAVQVKAGRSSMKAYLTALSL